MNGITSGNKFSITDYVELTRIELNWVKQNVSIIEIINKWNLFESR